MERLLLRWHLGLGDAIICAGLVAELAKTNQVVLPCYERNRTSIESIFRRTPNVEFYNVTGDDEVLSLFNSVTKTLTIGNPTPVRDCHWTEKFYMDAGVDYEKRYEFEFPETFEKSNYSELFPGYEFILICNDSSIGKFDLKNISSEFKKVSPRRSNSILDYANHIYSAKEIHCIDSAFLHLCEQVTTTGKLFYHKYARPGSNDFKFRKEWIVYE